MALATCCAYDCRASPSYLNSAFVYNSWNLERYVLLFNGALLLICVGLCS